MLDKNIKIQFIKILLKASKYIAYNSPRRVRRKNCNPISDLPEKDIMFLINGKKVTDPHKFVA